MLAVPVSAQKGIDTQTQTIREGGNKIKTGNDVSRSIDFGKGKTKTRERLSNPYKLASKRDLLIQTITDVLTDMRVLVDDLASRPEQGIVVTQPFTFAKGAIITKNELNRYAILPISDQPWTRGRYTFTIEIQSIDGNYNNVFVTAKVEGRTDNGLGSEWATLPSSGQAEEDLLIKLVESVTGINPDDALKPDKEN